VLDRAVAAWVTRYRGRGAGLNQARNWCESLGELSEDYRAPPRGVAPVQTVTSGPCSTTELLLPAVRDNGLVQYESEASENNLAKGEGGAERVHARLLTACSCFPAGLPLDRGGNTIGQPRAVALLARTPRWNGCPPVPRPPWLSRRAPGLQWPALSEPRMPGAASVCGQDFVKSVKPAAPLHCQGRRHGGRAAGVGVPARRASMPCRGAGMLTGPARRVPWGGAARRRAAR
jgi:hypothetical protein